MNKISMGRISSLAFYLYLTLIAACTNQPQQTVPKEKIIVAAYAGDSGALVYIAENQGYFKDNGLDVTIKDYEAGKLATDALLAGQADISTATEFVFVSNSFNNSDLRVIGTIATARVNELIARKDHGINTPEDLKGKKIGITIKSIGEFNLGRFLTFNGLSMDVVEVVDMKPSALVEAITKGHIDATLTWDPNIYNIKKRLEENALAWPAQGGQDFYFILITKKGWIKKHPSATKRFLKALLEAEHFVKENVTQVKEFMKQKFNYQFDYIEYSYTKHHFVVKLPQALLLAMEDQARWRIANRLTNKTEIPNYFNCLYLNGLKALKPEAVAIIH